MTKKGLISKTNGSYSSILKKKKKKKTKQPD